jgi:catechol-2,3-dioxygenase
MLKLEHINLPARDPIGLAKWYADTFQLKTDEHRAVGADALIVFVPGEPLGKRTDAHFGFRVDSNATLTKWAGHFDKEIMQRGAFNSIQVFDPEGNCFEVYCPPDA